MKEFSKEIINIGGVEYTLFLNREGIIALEKFTREEKQKSEEIRKMYQDIENGKVIEINDETDPFEGLENVDVDKIYDLQDKIYEKLFWILLRTTHKLPYSEAKELYKKAKEEYGHQVIELCDQMIEDANIDKVSVNSEDNKNLKKLEALRPTK